MKFSLLYRIPEEESVCDITYHLSLDRTANTFCRDPKKAEMFLHVLRRPLRNVENILFRQQIFQDFITFPSLFDELKIAFNRYDKIQSDWLDLRAGVRPAAAGAMSDALLDYTFQSLKVTAIFPRTILSFYESFGEILSRYAITSPCLCEMRDYCIRMQQNRALQEIVDISNLFQYYEAEDYHFTVLAEFDRLLRICACELTDIREKKTDREKKLFPLGFSRKKDSCQTADAGTDAMDAGRRLVVLALCHIDSTLTAVTNAVYETFSGLSQDMLFYDAAIAYAEHLTECELPLCFPRMAEAQQDILQISGLRDPFLLTEGMRGDQIISNDVSMAQSGSMLIRGGNSTGKTTFLRALGTAQIFAQAGLPICAKDALLSVRRGIFSHFSSAEEDDARTSPAGRFEGEVRELASIMDTIRPYSLVLLNETFQTTAYHEGAVGMYDILCALERLHCKFVFVTHLSEIFHLAEQGDLSFSLWESGEGANAFRILPVSHN